MNPPSPPPSPPPQVPPPSGASPRNHNSSQTLKNKPQQSRTYPGPRPFITDDNYYYNPQLGPYPKPNGPYPSGMNQQRFNKHLNEHMGHQEDSWRPQANSQSHLPRVSFPRFSASSQAPKVGGNQQEPASPQKAPGFNPHQYTDNNYAQQHPKIPPLHPTLPPNPHPHPLTPSNLPKSAHQKSTSTLPKSRTYPGPHRRLPKTIHDQSFTYNGSQEAQKNKAGVVYFLPKEEWIGISDRDFVGPILDFIHQQSLSPGDTGWAAPVWPGESAEMGRMFREGLEECVKGYLEMNKALGWKRGWWDRERAEEILGEIELKRIEALDWNWAQIRKLRWYVQLAKKAEEGVRVEREEIYKKNLVWSWRPLEE